VKVIYGLENIGRISCPVVALGVFDGVHLAHRRLLYSVVKKAAAIKGRSVVMTFSPHPQKEPSLYSLPHRLKLIEKEGINTAIVVNFNKRFAGLSAEDFIRKILVTKLKAAYVFIGENFRFGRGAQGNYKTLREFSRRYNFGVGVCRTLKINRRPVSSSYIRRLITGGKLKEAARLLSRPVSVLGTVVKGVSLGRKLGFPTANIDPHHEVLPPSGIYAVQVILGKRKMKGVCYIGSRPTFKNRPLKNIEVYIFNFKENIYHRDLEIHFVKRVRGDMRFSSKELLIKQIKKDLIIARGILSHQKPTQYLP